jgi:hypothetical protein
MAVTHPRHHRHDQAEEDGNDDGGSTSTGPARTIAITLGIYSHVSPTLHDEAAQLIGDLIMPPPVREAR